MCFIFTVTMVMWTTHLEGGPKRVNHAAVAIKDFIYSFGGYCTGDDYKVLRPIDVHRFYTCETSWQLVIHYTDRFLN